MKMKNAMMNTNGTMKEMGISIQQMDMDTVMYPEITGGTGDTTASANNNLEKRNVAESKNETMQGMNMGNMQHSNMSGLEGYGHE
jgi:hypothetical protein